MKIFDGNVELPRWLPNVTDVTSFLKHFTAVPVLLLAYICHYNAHRITKELQDTSEMHSIVVRICYAIHIMLVAPIIAFGLRLNLDGLLFPSAKPLVLDNKRFTILTVVLIALIFIGATFIPSIWDVFQFGGATTGLSIALIFPAAVALKDRHGIATKKDSILGIFMVVLAIFSSALAIYSDAYSLF
ncbi:hypothetical protein AMTR_s00006p00255160 [Amborella trichopoda]|uniref:Amino acid transporter transmembrane domain-containing protein n=1 Tax=Amborella trichopoda TaxID=13333 RepID=W1PDT7_AMBTC|nr:hypothetical protein AMTR_s00006p00255160 [Amborella trichopoda]